MELLVRWQRWLWWWGRCNNGSEDGGIIGGQSSWIGSGAGDGGRGKSGGDGGGGDGVGGGNKGRGFDSGLVVLVMVKVIKVVLLAEQM